MKRHIIKTKKSCVKRFTNFLKDIPLRVYFIFILTTLGIYFSRNLDNVSLANSNDMSIFIRYTIKEPSEFRKCVIELNRWLIKNNFETDLDIPTLIKYCVDYQVDPVFVISQGIVESNLGKCGASRFTKNVWNIGHFDNMTTHQVLKSKYSYKHVNLSIEPYLKLLKKYYLVNGRTEHDLMRYFVNNHGNRYASNLDYEVQISALYNKINQECGSLYHFKNILRNHSK